MSKRHSLSRVETVRLADFLRTVAHTDEERSTPEQKWCIYHDTWSDENVAKHLGVSINSVRNTRQGLLGDLKVHKLPEDHPKKQQVVAPLKAVLMQRIDELERRFAAIEAEWFGTAKKAQP